MERVCGHGTARQKRDASGAEYLYIAERIATARARRVESKSSVDLERERDVRFAACSVCAWRLTGDA